MSVPYAKFGYTPASTRNFSFNVVLSGALIYIASEQQMIVYQTVEIETGGELEINGEVVIIE